MKVKKALSPWTKQCKAQMVILGKSLSDLSRETSLSRTYISSIINERISVPDETVRLICDALEVNMPMEQ